MGSAGIADTEGRGSMVGKRCGTPLQAVATAATGGEDAKNMIAPQGTPPFVRLCGPNLWTHWVA